MTATEHSLLPDGFADLEQFVATWSLADTNARYDRRLESSMDDMQLFYDTLVPRVPAALAYLDQLDLYDLPDPALNLFYMLASLSAVGFALDVFHQPRVPDAGQGTLPWVRTPVP